MVTKDSNKKKMSPKARMMAKKEKESGQNQLTGIRKIISDNILKSVQSSAQFTLHLSADSTHLMEQYKSLKLGANGVKKVSLNDLLLFAVMKTLKSFPDLNAQFDNSTYSKKEDVNLGFAVDIPEGLIVPVIKKAQGMNIAELSDETSVLIEKCKNGTVKPDELTGGTFTVSNMGMYKIEKFTPILNYPEVGILGIGSIFPKAIRKDKGIEYVDCIEFSLTLNHQVIDGAKGARFLNKLAENISSLDFRL